MKIENDLKVSDFLKGKCFSFTFNGKVFKGEIIPHLREALAIKIMMENDLSIKHFYSKTLEYLNNMTFSGFILRCHKENLLLLKESGGLIPKGELEDGSLRHELVKY